MVDNRGQMVSYINIVNWLKLKTQKTLILNYIFSEEKTYKTKDKDDDRGGPPVHIVHTRSHTGR